MQATMFNEAARKFFDKFEIGKVYYISKGTIKMANKEYTTIDNNYEMTLSQYSQVDEVINELMVVPERKFNFVPLDQLGPYINQENLVGKTHVHLFLFPSSCLILTFNIGLHVTKLQMSSGWCNMFHQLRAFGGN